MFPSEFYWLRRDISSALLGWVVFLCSASVYCILYNQVVLLNANSFLHSFLWSLKEYAHWLLLTPVLFIWLQGVSHKQATNNGKNIITPLIVIFLIALFTRVVVDIYSNPNAEIAANLVYFFPSQLYTLIIVSILWKLSRPNPVKEKNSQNVTDSNCEEPSDTVLVIKGNGEKIIRWDSVICIIAAGNYLELKTENDQYLLRKTMKQLDAKLPKEKFIRIHRSYIVNITKLEKIISQPAGNGLVYLCNGLQLPLSKSYKKQLKSFRLDII